MVLSTAFLLFSYPIVTQFASHKVYNSIGDCMIVYVDVLIILNFVIDYLLLNLSAYILGKKVKTLKLIIVSFFSSLTSMTIFLPYLGVLGEITIKFLTSYIISLITFGKKKILKSVLTFLTVCIVFNGIMTVVWLVFKPYGMIINNSVVYFDISPIELIVASVVSYLLIKSVLCIVRRNAPLAQRCNIELFNNNKIVRVTGIIDTGNSLKDVYTGKQVIITDFKIAEELLGDYHNLPGFLLPYQTVSEVGLIPAYPIEKAKIDNTEVKKLLLAVSKIEFDSDYKVILNPEIL